jgi:nitrogen fixation NifU-like protein
MNKIYNQIILDHNKYPHNYYKMKNANFYLKGDNPLCGDQLEIFCYIEKNIIQNISFYGHGCAISKASASIMTYIITNKTIADALKIFKLFHKFLIGEGKDMYRLRNLTALLIFEHIKKTPMRLKCAMLPWHTLKLLLEKKYFI